MFVYRVENENGRGPYNPGNISYKDRGYLWDLTQKFCNSDYHRAPCEEKISIDRNLDERFGFATFKALRNWFNDFVLSELFKLGFKVYQYELCDGYLRHDKVGNTTKQCLFVKRHAISKEEVRIKLHKILEDEPEK